MGICGAPHYRLYVSGVIMWRHRRRAPDFGGTGLSRHIISRSLSPVGQGVPGTPAMGRAQCWSFISSIRGYLAAFVTGARRRDGPDCHYFGRSVTSAIRPRSISVGLAVSANLSHARNMPIIRPSSIDFLVPSDRSAPYTARRQSSLHAGSCPNGFSPSVSRSVWPITRRLSGSPAAGPWPGAEDLRGAASCRTSDPGLARRPVPEHPLATMTGEHVLALVEHLLGCRQRLHAGLDHLLSSHVSPFSTVVRPQRPGSCPLRAANALLSAGALAAAAAWEDVRRAIDAIDVTTPAGVRNRAILLLLATTGLRNKELRSLELQDIRWRAAEVFVRRTKARRDRVVPLLQEAGEALADYVLHARPKSNSQRVFLTIFRRCARIECGTHFQDRSIRTGAGRHRASVSPAPICYAIAWRRSSSGNGGPSTRSRICSAIGASTRPPFT